jgi:hypothetical protein
MQKYVRWKASHLSERVSFKNGSFHPIVLVWMFLVFRFLISFLSSWCFLWVFNFIFCLLWFSVFLSYVSIALYSLACTLLF